MEDVSICVLDCVSVAVVLALGLEGGKVGGGVGGLGDELVVHPLMHILLSLHHLLLMLQILFLKRLQFLLQIKAAPLRLLCKVHMIDRYRIVDLNVCVIAATWPCARLPSTHLLIHIQWYLPRP